MNFDDMELMQLQFCMRQTKDQMSMGGEIRRHASITQKIGEEMKLRKEKPESSGHPDNCPLIPHRTPIPCILIEWRGTGRRVIDTHRGSVLDERTPIHRS